MIDCCSYSLCGFRERCLFCCAVLGVLSSFEIALRGKRKPVALLLVSSWCHVAFSVLCLFLAMPRAGLRCVTVAFPGKTH